jgi:hypothetical protein
MLALTVPGLLAPGAPALSAMAPFQALARYADPPEQNGDGLGPALCATLGMPSTTPLAPISALGAGVDVGDRYTIAATPVTLIADRDIVMLAGAVKDLADDDAATLIELFNRHFGGDGLHFVSPRPAAWFAQCERTFSLSASPVDAAIGRSIFSYLPRGSDGGIWRRWQVEAQMLLHEHPVNQQREARGLAPVSSLWFSGGGRLSDVTMPGLSAVFAAADENGDLARGLAGGVGLLADVLPVTLSAILDKLDRTSDALVALTATTDEAAIGRFGRDWLQPAVAALDAGKIDALQLIADGHGAAASWRARRPSGLARVASRLRSRAFDIPAIAEE